MQRSMFLIIAALVMTVAASGWSDVADARLGGGRSMGAQRPSVTPRATAPQSSAPQATTPSGAASQPVMPATPGATLPGRPAAPAAGPAPSGASRWLGPIAGIAAGLGLAALLAHFGLPEGFGSFLLIALVVIGGVMLVRMLLARRSTPQSAYAGSVSPVDRNAHDAQAPNWGGGNRVEPVMRSPITPSAGGRPLPPDFDAAAFIKNAKQQFVRLQAAHDAGDRSALAEVLTPEMYAEIGRDLDTRVGRDRTEVIKVDAQVLEVETEADRHWASVRFTGELRENGAATTTPFDEVWNLTKPVDGSTGWLLAGIQQFA
jgi:predicted lipid-binding transport protein (Tim44 family)